MTEYRNKYQSLANDSKARLGAFNSQVSRLREANSTLDNQVKQLTAERDNLKIELAGVNSVAASGSSEQQTDIQNMRRQIEALTREKLALENQLSAAKSIATPESSTAIVRYSSIRVSMPRAH